MTVRRPGRQHKCPHWPDRWTARRARRSDPGTDPGASQARDSRLMTIVSEVRIQGSSTRIVERPRGSR